MQWRTRTIPYFHPSLAILSLYLAGSPSSLTTCDLSILGVYILEMTPELVLAREPIFATILAPNDGAGESGAIFAMARGGVPLKI